MAATLVLGPAFDTGKVMANLFSAYRVGSPFDTRKLLGPGFDTAKVATNLLSAYRLMPTSPHGPASAPADPGWLHQLLNDEERIRAAFPLLAASSGTCMVLGGLLFVALVDPAVRAALEMLSDEASITAADDDPEDLDPAAAALSKSRQWVLIALRAGGELQTVKQLGDRLAHAGHPLKPRTIRTALGKLEAAGLAWGSEEGNGRARYWSPAPTDDGAGGGAGTP